MKKFKKYICLSKYNSSENNAGPKAKVDIEKVLKNNYDFICKSYNIDDKNVFEKFIKNLKKYLFIFLNNTYDNLFVIQWPFSSNRLIKNIKNKIIIIHDLNGLRKKNDEELKKEIKIFDSSLGIVSHNRKMTDYLIGKGLKNKNIFNIELFDYLMSSKQKNVQKIFNVNKLTVVYCGNLTKSKFLNELEEKRMNYYIKVYGNKVDFDNKKIEYMGSYSPEEIPNVLDGDLGLIWDGSLNDIDSLKEYTMYNNPHKLSCYIVAELPVIVWSKSAIASFIKENNIGYVVDNVYDINTIDFSDYALKKKNIKRLAKLVKNGHYSKQVIDKLLKEI